MSKSANKTTTEAQTPPTWATNFQLGGLSSAMSAISPYLTPGYGQAGLTPDEQTAFGMIRQNAAAPPSVAWNPAQAATVAGAPTAQAAQGTAAQLGANEYQQFLNPYTQDVVGTTLSQMRDQQAQNLNDIRARAAAAHSFAGSGSRAALQSAQSEKNFGQQVASTVAQLMSAGYDKATANAMANAQLRQQTGLANTGYQQQANLTNAQLQQTRDLAQAGYEQQANLFNSTGATNAAQANIGYQQNALAQLLGIGQLQQQQTQAGLSQPLTAATTLAGILPQGVGSNKTTVAPSTSPSTLQTILGLAGTVGGSVLGGPMGAGIGSALGTGIGSLFGPSQSDLMNVGRTGFY